MPSANEAAARSIIEQGFAEGRLEVFDEVCSPDYVSHDPAEPEDVVGIPAHKERAAGYKTAMSDLNITVEDCFESGDTVVIRWRARGTNDGELMGMPPSGRSMDITGTSIDRFDSDGRLVESWDQWDNLGFMTQLGISAEALTEAG